MFPVEMQQALCAHLTAHPFFSAAPAIPVIPRSQGDVLTAVQEAKARTGLCCLVGPAGGTFTGRNTRSVVLEGRYTLTFIENPDVNRGPGGTGVVVEAAAWAAAMILHPEIPRSAADNTPLSGGNYLLESFSDAVVEDNHGAVNFICELTVKSTGGTAPNTSLLTLTRNS